MAVYKIFPAKDATLYSYYPTANTSIDEILEVGNTLTIDGVPNVARSLIQFDDVEIADIIDNKINNSSFDVNLRTFISYAQGIISTNTLEIYPIAENWSSGTGKYLDIPTVTNGVSWNSASLSTSWTSSGLDLNGNSITSSFNTTYVSQGGGSWIYSGSGISNYKVTESFSFRSNKDLNISVKTIIEKWYSGSIVNNGFILKLSGSEEFISDPNFQPILKYYSVDTNTIYPPQLEFKWRDYSTILSGSESTILSETPIKLSLNENPGFFYKDSINRFRVNSSPLYPPRTYQTSSYFTNQYYLPTSSYYAIKDLDTNEFVVDFDTSYTQISADSKGNYFDVYMNGLEPERYYKILIQTIIDGSTLIIDDNFNFKVINP